LFDFRFYFVGDEDLLEIIGNSKNVAKLQKHFKKMFAGVSSIILNEDNSVVLGISSREGEEVSAVPLWLRNFAHTRTPSFLSCLFIFRLCLKLQCPSLNTPKSMSGSLWWKRR
jgi:hypothetical protein